jgi:hypothetical protein
MAMERSRRDQIVLGVLLVILAVVGYRAWTTTSAPTAPPAVRGRTAATNRSAGSGATLKAPDVHLTALDTEHPEPQPVKRDLFRFKPKAQVPAAGNRRAVTPSRGSSGPAVPAGVSGLPPIPLKFIGIVEATDSKARVAVLSDGRGAPFYGREGEPIGGRYRILRIGDESIEMSYLDGRGRQTIRLSGR